MLLGSVSLPSLPGLRRPGPPRFGKLIKWFAPQLLALTMTMSPVMVPPPSLIAHSFEFRRPSLPNLELPRFQRDERSFVAKVAEKVGPTVVCVEVRGAKTLSRGSGLIYSKKGEVLTNAHVLQAAVPKSSFRIFGFSDFFSKYFTPLISAQARR